MNIGDLVEVVEYDNPKVIGFKGFVRGLYTSAATGRAVAIVELFGMPCPGDDSPDGYWRFDVTELTVEKTSAEAAPEAGTTVSIDPDAEAPVARKDQGARFDLIPAYPMWLLAELYTAGAQKYDAHNWRAGRPVSAWSAAAERHLQRWKAGEDIDPETGCHHLTSVVFHMFAILEQWGEGRDGLDDRYHAGAQIPLDMVKRSVIREA